MKTNSIHQFSVEGITGNDINFADFAGKKVIVVNVASHCGFTPQYKQLEELYLTYKDHLVIIGFPCNDFGGQEPGSNSAIQQFCRLNYAVTFPLAAKISIKGALIHPIYNWLTKKPLNKVADTEVKWNFHKFLLDENGQLIKSLPSSCSPFDDEILNWLST